VAHKTNAVRLLEQLGIQYELREYEVDPEQLDAEIVAAKIGFFQSRSSKRWSLEETAMEFAWP
jgi:prolyl-tRNA editing enzyme YbaK/EbsC (Cys-tRNA(Pro) deacylase)